MKAVADTLAVARSNLIERVSRRHFAFRASRRADVRACWPHFSWRSEQFCSDDFAITTGELEVIGTPADVRAQCNHDAVMRAPWPAAGMPF